MNEFIQSQVGEEAEQAITNIQDEQGELAAGNVLRRTCVLGGEVCKAACQLRSEWEMFYDDPNSRKSISEAVVDKACADINLFDAIQRIGLKPSEVLMVGVTANNVGFADKLDEYDKLNDNPYGWRELPGFNAFFARKGEVGALGRRLADCADVNFEFKDQEGNTVFGFEHGTRTNMFGSSEYPFEKDGQKMSYTEYALREAVEHYGADPASVKIRLAAAIQGHNFKKNFNSRKSMESHLPGWYEDGFVANASNPGWKEGDAIVEADEWHADTRDMIIRDIEQAMEALGVPAENFDKSTILDPNESQGMFSSHESSKLTGIDSRDLYITYIK